MKIDELVEKKWTKLNSLTAYLEFSEELCIWAHCDEDGNVHRLALDDKHNHIIPLPLYNTYSQLESLVAMLTGNEQVCIYRVLSSDISETGCGVIALTSSGNYCTYCGRRITRKE
jgi:hypothetical protein